MVQGAGVLKGKPKIQKKRVNRHGKTPRCRKGKMVKPPVNPRKRKEWEDQQKIARMRNEKGIQIAQANASTAGERLRISDLPPVLTSSSQQQQKKEKKKKKMQDEMALG